MNKGFIFTLDAILALGIVLVLVSGIGIYFTLKPEMQYRNIHSQTEDGMELLSVQIKNLENYNFLKKKNLTESPNQTALELIGSLWVSNKTDLAGNVTKSVLDDAVKNCFELTFSDESIYKNCEEEGENIAISSRLASGYKTGGPAKGFVSRAFFDKLRKITSKYIYFGGYVGDGNITRDVKLNDMDKILNINMNMDVGGSFNLYLNENLSGSYSPTYENMSSNTFTVCNSTYNNNYCKYLKNGNNTIKLNFTSNQSAIRGGFIRIRYNTSEFITDSMTHGYDFPGINGLINLYSSFYVPGNLTNMKGKLHYKTDGTIFLKVGNATVYRNDTNDEVLISIDNSTLGSEINNNGLSYNYLSGKTIPLRLGLEEMALGRYRPIIDSVSVIDVSGSMDGNKLSEAKNSAKTFADVILNVSGNRAGLVAYESGIDTVHELTTNDDSLEGTIDGLNAYGGTCIACGILESIDVLSDPKYETIISRKSIWKYNISYPNGEPPTKDGKEWYDISYSDSNWENGEAILGYGPNTNTNIEKNGGDYFFRKTFDYDKKKYKDVKGYLRSEDFANLYVNGYLIDNDTSKNDGEYWNIKTGEFTIDNVNQLFGDDFERSLLGNNWSVTDGYEGNEIDINNYCGGTVGPNSVALRWGGGTLTSNMGTSNDGYVTDISFDFKQGGDSGGCDNPESGDDVYLEYLNSDNSWKELKMFDGGSNDPPEGSWKHYHFGIPSDGLHKNFEIRFRYPSASGYDYDYWSLDNITFTISDGREINEINESILNDGKNVIAAKLKNLNESEKYNWITNSNFEWDEGSLKNTTTYNGNLKLEGIGSIFYDGFEGGNLNDWSCSGTCGVSYECAEIGSYAAFLSEESGSATSPDVDLSQINNANISYWVKKGSDSCSENPDGDEDFYVEYYDENGDWNQLDFFDCGSIADGTSQTVKHSLPSNALHPNFKVRFRQTGGSGTNYDYWHFDEVNIEGSSGEKTSGSYLSKTFDAGQNVTWLGSTINKTVPTGTDFSINYTDTNEWYDSIDNIPKSRYLRYNIFLDTEDSSKTPKVDMVNISYKANEIEFDFELKGLLKRNKSMVVMSDGKANEEPPDFYSQDLSGPVDNNWYCSSGEDDPCDDAIHAACLAKEKYNITVYTVGFGSDVDDKTLNKTAECGGGKYYKADVGELEEIFRNISETLLELSFAEQESEISGDFTSRLFPDSYLQFNYTTQRNPLKYGEMSLKLESPQFGGNVTSPKNGTFRVPPNSRPLEGKITSYSSEYWTDRLLVKNLTSNEWDNVYKLWDFDENYQYLGDPYYVHIPRDYIKEGQKNYVSIDTGVSKNKTKGGSPDNKIILEVAFKNSVPYSDVFPKAEGSTRKVYYDMNGDGNTDGSIDITIGPNPSDPYDPNKDAIDDAFSRLINRLNFINDTGIDDGNSTNPIDIKIPEVKFDNTRVGGVKWLWGPSIFTLKVW